MKQFGVEVINNDYQEFVIPAGQHYVAPGDFLVEGDASSASYFLAAAAIKGGEVKVTGIGKNSIQGDIQFADALEKWAQRLNGAMITLFPASVSLRASIWITTIFQMQQ